VGTTFGNKELCYETTIKTISMNKHGTHSEMGYYYCLFYCCCAISEITTKVLIELSFTVKSCGFNRFQTFNSKHYRYCYYFVFVSQKTRERVRISCS